MLHTCNYQKYKFIKTALLFLFIINIEAHIFHEIDRFYHRFTMCLRKEFSFSHQTDENFKRSNFDESNRDKM